MVETGLNANLEDVGLAGRNPQPHARLYFIWICQFVTVRFENIHVEAGFTIELLADLGQRIAGLDRVCLLID